MDTVLKQRLIGALVLVALAVIFLPMLVKGPAPDSGVANVPLKAPEAPADGQFETRELPLVTPGDAPSGGAVGMAKAPGAAAAPAAAPAPVQNNPDAADLADPAAGSAAQPLPPSTAAGNYAVNFGAYATAADADAVIARLKQAQLPGFREQATIGGRQAWRVRIGPYADRAQAESVRLQAVKVRNDVNAQVVTLDAAPSNATPASAAPAASNVAAAAPAAPAKTEALPPEPAKPVATAKPATPPALKPEPAKPAVTKPEPTKPAATPATTAAAKPAPSVPAAPAASGTGFAVQLGAFGKAEDANALRDKVRAAGFSAFVEQVRTDKGALNRVRVGPVANRADAEQLRAQVAAKVGISGMVRPHP
ncbi:MULTISPECIES: SPOR domain-containing protein [Xanthomonas]|uniref:SPOR domain-containing protein n=1 Tax=Xanthomonas TaxID=338 RepID=UPI001ADD5259|nr:SPOR domain-containing protein [Xanthomonas sp. A6251]MBO9875020.1 SPOR domain-containing protein [Xanthomonas sp. D-93]WNH45751.1 SPOR domain-containing protein [Xanthomonas sp. A6251]